MQKNDNLRWIIENPEDIIQKYLMNGKFFEADRLEYMSQHINENDTVIDIGANIGNHTVFLSKYTKAKLIYAIEPLVIAYKMLLCNIALNYCHNVNVDYIGLGLNAFEHVGYPYTVYEKTNLGATRIFAEEYPKTFIETYKNYYKEDPWKHHRVMLVTGDSLFHDKKIDFMKIDVEGMEMQVLNGLQSTIDKNKPKIFIEVSNEHVKDFFEWTQKNNYKVIKKFTPASFNPDDLYSNEDYMIVSN